MDMLLVLFSSKIPASLTVELGLDTLAGSNANMVSRNVSRIVPHPKYNDKTLDNDIALLQLSSPVTFNNYIKPVCLAASGSEFVEGTTAWVTGFGRIKTNSRLWFTHFC